jgi:hypothetical protein
MKIRDLKWRTLPMWPPEWFLSYRGPGEAGVLEDVQYRNDVAPELLIIAANYLGESRKGIVMLEESTQLETLFNKLKDNIGKPLTEIGFLDIDSISLLTFKNKKQVQRYQTYHQMV